MKPIKPKSEMRNQPGNFGVSARRYEGKDFNSRIYIYGEFFEGDPRLPKGYKNRKCLKCQKMFLSHGPGNRLCKRCHEQAKKGVYDE